MADDLKQPMLKDGGAEDDYEPGCCSKFAAFTGLCCFMNENEYKHQPLAEVVQNDKRRCTDVPCCLVLLTCIISEIVLIAYAASKGASPALLMHGYDARMTVQDTPEYSSAQLCDSSNPMGAYAVWPNLAFPSIRICAPDCSYTNDTGNLYVPGVSGGAMHVPYTSTPFLNSYCLPTGAMSVPDSFDSEAAAYQRAIADLKTTAWLIFIMSFAAILISFIYLRLISCIGRFLILMTILSILGGGVLLCWLLIENGIDDMDDESTAKVGKAEVIMGSILAVLLFLFILALWFMRKNIALVVEMLNEVSYAIRDMKWTLVFPVWISLAVMAFVTVWVVEALYIYSVKQETTAAWPADAFFSGNAFYSGNDSYFQLEFNDELQDAMIWHIVMLFYLSQVMIYFGYMVLASTFGDWYFSLWSDRSTKRKQRGEGPAELSHAPIMESLWRVLRFHLGSLAFGAAIITVIRIIRAVVTYIQAKVTASNPNNPLVKCLFCCVQCCLKCCQFVFDRVNKEGFVFISIYGTPFCYAAYTAFKILVHSLGRTVMVEGVSKYTELFGRVSVAALNTGIAVLVLKYVPYYQDTVSSYLVPAVVIFTMTYMIAAVFMMVFEVGVESIFLCFLVDEQVHGEPKFANHSLTEMAGAVATKAKDENAKKYSD